MHRAATAPTPRQRKPRYPALIVVAHTGFKAPANTQAEAEAIKARLDARYPGETSTIRLAGLR